MEKEAGKFIWNIEIPVGSTAQIVLPLQFSKINVKDNRGKIIKENINAIPILDIKQQAITALLNNGFEKVDYVEICDAITLQPITSNENSTQNIALIAAFLNGVRLIDNLIL